MCRRSHRRTVPPPPCTPLRLLPHTPIHRIRNRNHRRSWPVRQLNQLIRMPPHPQRQRRMRAVRHNRMPRKARRRRRRQREAVRGHPRTRRGRPAFVQRRRPVVVLLLRGGERRLPHRGPWQRESQHLLCRVLRLTRRGPRKPTLQRRR